VSELVDTTSGGNEEEPSTNLDDKSLLSKTADNPDVLENKKNVSTIHEEQSIDINQDDQPVDLQVQPESRLDRRYRFSQVDTSN
jgi:hypothetical protein